MTRATRLKDGTPEAVKARRAKQRKYYAIPAVKKRRSEYLRRPDVVKRRREGAAARLEPPGARARYLETMRAYYQDNKKRLKEYSHKYYETHREQQLASARRLYFEHRKETLEKQRKYHEIPEVKKRTKAYAAQYRKKTARAVKRKNYQKTRKKLLAAGVRMRRRGGHTRRV